MVLLQLGITYDDVTNRNFSYFPQSNGSIRMEPLSSTTALSRNVPIRVLRNVNLPAGRYKCNLTGVDVCSGNPSATTYAFPPQIIQIKSPQFVRQGGQSLGFCFANNNQYSIQDTGNDKFFYMNLTGGWIELEMTILQFSNQTISTNAQWAATQFAFIILTLDVELEDVKAMFGNAK